MSSQSATPSTASSSCSLSDRLQAVTEALAATRTADEVFRVILTPALQALGAVAGAVLLVAGTGARLEIAAAQGYAPGAETLWQDGPLDGNVPAGDALRRREALFFEHQGDLTRAYPELEARTGGVAAVATAVLPMFLDDSPLGTVILDFREPHHFTPEEERFLRTLAAQCAVALGRVGSLERLRQEDRRKTGILESISDAFYAVDREWRFTYVNREAERLWGRRREDLLGQVYWEAFPGAVGSAPYEAHLRAARERRVVRLESLSPILHIWVDIAIYPTPDGLSVYFKDISERRRAAQEIGELNRALERRVGERTQEAEAARSRAEVLAALGDALQAARSPEDVAVLALGPLGEALGASSAVVVRLEGGLIRVPTVWGDELPAMAALRTRDVPLAEAPLLAECARTGEAGYYADYNAARGGLAGLPELAFAVEPLRAPGGGVAGFLCVWRLPRPEPWPEGERDLLRRAADTLGLALERAATLQALEERTEALDAFVAFSEAVGSQTEVLALARRGIEVIRARFSGDSTFVYYERAGERWKARVWTEDLEAQPELLALLRDGLPLDTPLYAEAERTRQPVFTERWDAGRERVAHSEGYGAAANVPLVVGGEVRGFVALGLRHRHQWSERDREVVRAVGRGLNLALERAEAARQLQAGKDAVESRNRVLEAFAQLTRDLALEADPYRLIRRTQEVVLGLLPPGYSLYSEPEGGQWVVKSQVGPVTPPHREAALQRPPFEDTPNLLIPWCRGEAHYQDTSDSAADRVMTPDDYQGATVTLPIFEGGQVRGVLGFALSGVREWTPADRAMLDTVGRSLSLALERVEATARLVAQRQSLEAANEELEAFAYSVSHDLRTPVRHVMSFNHLLRKQLGEGLDAKVTRYLTVVDEAAGRMNTLIDAMLDLSRTSRLPLRLGPVDLGELVGVVRSELEADAPDREVEWRLHPLPLVEADPDTLRQVVTNLLDNALKYTRRREVARVEVWAEERPGEWVISVRDNGVGFDPRHSTKLFGVFQRLHRAEDFEGTGVGLANVRRIIARHGGRVWAQGQPEAGATFSFTLPRG